MLKFLKYMALTIIILLIVIAGYLVYLSKAHSILPLHTEAKVKNKEFVDSLTYKIDNCWIHKETNGLWDMYLEGNPLNRGIIAGKLSDSLIVWQERAFVNQIHRIIPSNFYLGFLKYIVACFNVNIHKAIPEEYKEEIYGISQSATHEYDFIGTPYQRILNYHGAHDLGHMLQNLGMVGCSSFALWDKKTKDGQLLVGRNFDFYVGDEFAKHKMVIFIKPDSGYCHAFVSWGGMMGAVSGMNIKGLTVTINAANSNITLKTATPVAILARNILQYASNINEAIAIATKFNVFVSEQFLIGSASENKAIVIEKTPKSQAIYSVNTNYIINTNHYQSKENKDLPETIKQKNQTASGYRNQRLTDLIINRNGLTYTNMAEILRDTLGLENSDIGLGNENSINQLIAHHSIIFAPARNIMWVSTSPFQEGKYVAYDLNKIFKMGVPLNGKEVSSKELEIAADSSFIKNAYKRYSNFSKIRIKINEGKASTDDINVLISLNPEFYYTYEISGDFYKSRKEFKTAKKYYLMALKHNLPGQNERNRIAKKYATASKMIED